MVAQFTTRLNTFIKYSILHPRISDTGQIGEVSSLPCSLHYGVSRSRGREGDEGKGVVPRGNGCLGAPLRLARRRKAVCGDDHVYFVPCHRLTQRA